MDWIDAIKSLGELRDAGLLTDDEFSLQKSLVLPTHVVDPVDFPCQPHERAHCDDCASHFNWDWVCTAHEAPGCNLCDALHHASSGLGEASDDSNQRADFSTWSCTTHGRLNCRSCTDSIRASRGRARKGFTWQCDAHEIEWCRECYYYP